MSDESAVLVTGAEIDFNAADPVAVEAVKLGVAEFLAVDIDDPVGHEGFVALLEDAFDIEHPDALAVRPAALEIGGPVDGVVIGTGEGEVVGQCAFDECRDPLKGRRQTCRG